MRDLIDTYDIVASTGSFNLKLVHRLLEDAILVRETVRAEILPRQHQ